jgi:hypothetical protein
MTVKIVVGNLAKTGFARGSAMGLLYADPPRRGQNDHLATRRRTSTQNASSKTAMPLICWAQAGKPALAEMPENSCESAPRALAPNMRIG